jgi:hypothetical protein
MNPTCRTPEQSIHVHFRREDADLVRVVLFAGGHDLDLLALASSTLLDPDQRIDAEVVVEP